MKKNLELLSETGSMDEFKYLDGPIFGNLMEQWFKDLLTRHDVFSGLHPAANSICIIH